MIAWLHPAALVGLLAAALPVLVHLLRRERAQRVIVPSLRFVHASERSAVRLRTPSDPWLLLLRIAIVACAALAAAHPLLLTDARHAGWDERVARAVVVDTSASPQDAIDAEQIASAASASSSVTVETQDLARGIARALSWLAAAPPARREIVIVSDFQRGSLSAADLASVPDAVGIRLVSVPSPAGATTPQVSILDREGAIAASATPLDDATAVTYGAASAIAGLEVVSAPEHAASIERLLRVVGAAGAIAPSPEQPIVIRFGGGEESSGHETAPAWAIAAGARLLRAPEVQGVDPGVSTRGGRLVVDVHAAPDSLAAALVVKAALDARLDPATFTEAEPQRLPDATLAAWSRAPGPADVSAWRQTDESDGRWLWALALVLLGVEAFVRRMTPPAVRVKEPHAA